MIAAALATPAAAIDEAIAATGRPLNVAVFVNSRDDLCYSRGYKAATERLAQIAADEVNRRGQNHRRPIQLQFFDNQDDSGTAIANIENALQGNDLVGMIGISGSQRGKEVFAKIADKIGASKVPFITRISVGEVFKQQPNVFSTLPSQEVERIPVMAKFIRDLGVPSITFLGREGSAYIDAIGAGLGRRLTELPFNGYHRVKLIGKAASGKLDSADLDDAITQIKASPPGLLVIAVGSSLTDDVLQKLRAANLDLPLFIVGRFTDALIRSSKDYPQPIYGMSFTDIPEVESDRLLNVLTSGKPGRWLFAGAKVAGAGRNCPPAPERSTFAEDNLRAVRRGTQFSDMVKLIAASAAKVGHNGRIEDYREQVLRDLRETYSVGRGAFKGTFENWSFHPDSRVRAETPFVVILPSKLGRTQLTPQQFLRVPDRTGAGGDSLKKIDTIYLDIDLIRLHSVDNNAKTFFAEFYLAMRTSDISIDDIAFTNALLDPKSRSSQNTTGREMAIEVLHNGGPSDAYPPDMRIYKVSGRFRFTPDFSEYPFDRQQFSIDLQAKSGEKTFIVQPPPASLRDTDVISDGWLPDRQYVSYIEDFVPIVDAFTHTPSIVPFYKARFVWQMERETTDYYIRVIVPLLFIMIVAYLSIFIPNTHLESIVTIQITALLAAVALYLSLPQVDTDTATVSDRIFMIDYIMVSSMIVVSILRINGRIVAKPWINRTLAYMHIVIIPVVVIGLFFYYARAEILTGFIEMPGWKLLGLG